MAFIPEDKLLEIKDAASIEEVVGQVVKLTQRGKNLLGLCPFHADTAPSFTVAPDKGIFHCFGCGAGGNVFSFVMQHQRLSFPEAVQELARRYGIPVTFKDLGPQGSRQAAKRTQAYEINQLAAAFYQTTLNAAEGKIGRDYLAKRGLTAEIIRNFRLGYAPEEWDALKRHLQSKGVSLELAQEAGLLVAKDRGGFYDRFRGRIIFPIQDRQGRVIAFGGRVVGQGEPKYLNSPESLLYTKGRNLYGVPQAAEALRTSGVALVVEGYLDLIALQVHGVANVVATLGTALTREQVRLLKSLADKVVLVFDGDAAGVRAMKRAFPLFAQESLPVRALPLPPGLDPDNYVQAHGPELFQAAWESAQPWFTYLLEGLTQAHGLDVQGRVRILEELKPYLNAVADPVEQDLWLKQAASRLTLDEGVLRRSLAGAAPVSPGRLEPGAGVVVSQEKLLLGWLLCNPEAVDPDELEEWLLELENLEFKELLEAIITCCREHGRLDHGLLVQQVEKDNLRRQICSLTLTEEEFRGPSMERATADWRRNLARRQLERAQQALMHQLATAGGGTGEEAFRLLAKQQEIQRQLEALMTGCPVKGENG
jgi:DNA primase